MADETFSDDFHDEDPEHLQRIEDLKTASRQIDPNGWINQEISHFETRSREIDSGATGEYDVVSYDNDIIYQDKEFRELQEKLRQAYDSALLGVAELQKAQRTVSERRDLLTNIDRRAQYSAHKILGKVDVTVEDIFPSDPKTS
ncbi:MAG: hypothetical protein WAV04_00930 [Candidatus Microsaccharimonas sp.]